MNTNDKDEVIAVAQPTVVRRAMAVCVIAGLGIAVLYVAMVQPGSAVSRLALSGLGIGAIWIADAIRRATAAAVELTPEYLRDSQGKIIVALNDIQRVDRGILAIKPSNGFMLRTKTAQAGGWRLGLWWRFGKHVGIGGMIPAVQTKVMAEKIVLEIEKRDPA